MTLKAIAIALLIPPTSLLFVTLAGLVIERWSRRIGRWLVWCSALALLVLAMPATGGSLLALLEHDLPVTPPADNPPQAIVILSGDVQRNRIEPPFQFPGALSMARVRAGALLARRTGLPVLITGGRLQPSDPPIATLMADVLTQDYGVPVRWIEAKSRDTWENAYLSAEILRAQGVRSVYLVTHAWHMPRAITAFAGTGITVTAAPTQFDRIPTQFAVDFVPSVGGWRSSYLAFHELLGGAWYALR